MSQYDKLWAKCEKAKIILLALTGPHAGENVCQILRRKKEDIRKTKHTLWAFAGGNKKLPSWTAHLPKQSGDVFVLFVTGDCKPAKKGDPAKFYQRDDDQEPQEINRRLSPVTGSLPASALMLDQLEWPSGSLPPICYSVNFAELRNITGNSTRFTQSCSTMLVLRRGRAKGKRRERTVIAIGRLKLPDRVVRIYK